MEALLDTIRRMRAVGGERLAVDGAAAGPFAAVDPSRLCVEVAPGASAQLVVLHTAAGAASLEIALGEGASLDFAEVFLAEAFAELRVQQAARSTCRMTAVELASANAAWRVSLEGREASCDVGALFLAGAGEHGVVRLRTDHRVADCRSESLVKGVAAADGVGEFHGLVYVAPDAQRTDARQQSRNVVLGDAARIVAEPQLEIYADDVKCSHGATVGQMDDEAVFYMRQRGLSEAQARRLQLEGFAGDVVARCGIEPLGEALAEAVAARLARI